MDASQQAGTKAGPERIAAGPVTVAQRLRGWSRAAGKGDTSGHVAIASTVFLVLFASALLIGGHAAIDPLLRASQAARNAARVGDVVYAMPDGVFCRHMSFDNTTAELTESALEHCSTDAAGQPRPEVPHRAKGFAWGGH
jgi:hypothetical protein